MGGDRAALRSVKIDAWARRSGESSQPGTPEGPRARGRTTRTPVVLAVALAASGCFREFGKLPSVPDASDTDASADASVPDGGCGCRVNGGCRAVGEFDPADPCRECVPERSTEDWTDRCPNHLTETTLEDFSDGTMPRSLGNLYVSADGAVRVVRSGDLNDDGFVDLVFSNHGDQVTKPVESYVYWGSVAGFSTENRTELPTLRAAGASAADLDADGFVDIVFSDFGDGVLRSVRSYVYWGSEAGFTPSNRTDLPTVGAYSNSVADLDADGFLDIVFCNWVEDDGGPAVESYLYWGGDAGFSETRRTALPTTAATGSSAADLDGDGFLDLVISNHEDDSSYSVDSHVYWGSPEGVSAGDRTALPTRGAIGNSIGDLDDDGFLDLVFAAYRDDSGYAARSFIYWGSPQGYSQAARAEVATVGAPGISVADLDGDGSLDLAFSNQREDDVYAVDSYVYWGSGGRSDWSRRTDLPTLGSTGNVVADFDGDGFLDLAFSNYWDGAGFTFESYLYWGSPTGFSPDDRVGLPTLGADVGITADLGNVYDRRPEEEYLSSAIDLGPAGNPTAIAWDAETPLGSSVSLQIRSASTLDGLAAAPWTGPAADPATMYERPFARLGGEHAGHRYLQYRAVFSTPGFLGRPALHSVTVHWECTLDPPGCCSDRDCGDGDTCTRDRCEAGSCQHEPTECCDDADCPDRSYCDRGRCACGPAPDFQIVDGECLPSCGQALDRAGFEDVTRGCCGTPCLDRETERTWDCAHCCEDTGAGSGCS